MDTHGCGAYLAVGFSSFTLDYPVGVMMGSTSTQPCPNCKSDKVNCMANPPIEGQDMSSVRNWKERSQTWNCIASAHHWLVSESDKYLNPPT
jgi:hypothetical protein